MKWKQLLLVSILLGLTISLTNSEVPENESKSREKRSGMLSSPLDLEDVRQAVFSPMTISNQFSATFGINGMRLIGWTTGGISLYKSLKNLYSRRFIVSSGKSNFFPSLNFKYFS